MARHYVLFSLSGEGHWYICIALGLRDLATTELSRSYFIEKLLLQFSECADYQ